jgi:hypothetical protein
MQGKTLEGHHTGGNMEERLDSPLTTPDYFTDTT